MEYFKTNYAMVSTLVFVGFILLAHVFATNNYDWTKNTISDLGAQGYSRKLIMQLGFLAFGISLAFGIMLNGSGFANYPILIYAVSVALTGFFCTKPFFNVESYSSTQSLLHSTFAQLSGIAFSIGILTQAFYASDNRLRYIHVLFFVLVIGLSASFGLLKNYQGIMQRLLYLISFIWLVKYFKA